ncbi:MAG: ATP-binding protein, partial [Gemmataceae bacterium]
MELHDLRLVPGVVAVSGGADSVCLWRVLVAVGATVQIVHINHQLRGAA